jgi:protein-tyrosine phosphatase
LQEGFPDSANRHHYPIVENRNDQEESIKSAIQAVTEAVKEGKKVFFHCAGGRNRTGTVATALFGGQSSDRENIIPIEVASVHMYKIRVL